VRALLASTLLIAACTAPPSGLPTSPATETPGGPPLPSTAGDRTLYLTDSFNGSGLIAIDLLTLRDLSARPLLPIGPGGGNSSFMASALDGSAVAVMNYWYGDRAVAQGLEISVFDGRTGALRARFHPEVPVIVDGLSPDGSRIYARNWPPRELTAERLVLDASTGKILEREPRIDLASDAVAYARDERGRRLYALLVPIAPNATGPQPVELGAWDLSTGKELWRLGLPTLAAGQWLTGRTIDGLAVRSSLAPGLGLSPDGRQLAVVKEVGCCVPGGTLWLIDAQGGKIISERAYGPKASFFDRLVAPLVAEAKSWDESVGVSASFFPDGRTLHVYAQSSRVDEQGEPRHQYLGMAAVRLADASVTGTDIKMELLWYENRILWVRPSPDGRWLYVFLQRAGSPDPDRYVLRRLDPATLRVLAERRFDGYRQAYLLASR